MCFPSQESSLRIGFMAGLVTLHPGPSSGVGMAGAPHVLVEGERPGPPP